MLFDERVGALRAADEAEAKRIEEGKAAAAAAAEAKSAEEERNAAAKKKEEEERAAAEAKAADTPKKEERQSPYKYQKKGRHSLRDSEETEAEEEIKEQGEADDSFRVIITGITVTAKHKKV